LKGLSPARPTISSPAFPERIHAGAFVPHDPSGSGKLRFVTGGDIGVSSDVALLFREAAKLSPAFGMVGGDIAYAGDLFSWYAGSLDADVYFCPERHGTYFGSFYIKDAPAIGDGLQRGVGVRDEDGKFVRFEEQFAVGVIVSAIVIVLR
jgi:hypothetical protein